MFAEAIPGVIIQLSALMFTTESIPYAALASLAISALTTGFTSATISYDMDTDAMQRKHNPEFYGYIPDSAKTRAGEMRYSDTVCGGAHCPTTLEANKQESTNAHVVLTRSYVYFNDVYERPQYSSEGLVCGTNRYAWCQVGTCIRGS